MNAKSIGQKYDEKRDICLISEYLSTKYLLITMVGSTTAPQRRLRPIPEPVNMFPHMVKGA